MPITTLSLGSSLAHATSNAHGQFSGCQVLGRISAVLDKCGTKKKLAKNAGRIKVYTYDPNTRDVLRDDNGFPVNTYREYTTMSTTPWRDAKTGHESNAQVRYAVLHCDLVRDRWGTVEFSADGTKTFRWSVVPAEFVYIATADHPELVGTHVHGGELESIALAAHGASSKFEEDTIEDFEPDLIGERTHARAWKSSGHRNLRDQPTTYRLVLRDPCGATFQEVVSLDQLQRENPADATDIERTLAAGLDFKVSSSRGSMTVYAR